MIQHVLRSPFEGLFDTTRSQYPYNIALTQHIEDVLDFPGQSLVYVILGAHDEYSNSHGTLPREKILMGVEDLVDPH